MTVSATGAIATAVATVCTGVAGVLVITGATGVA